MSLAVVAAAIVALVALVVWAKVHPFLAFVVVSAATALALGMPAGDVAGSAVNDDAPRHDTVGNDPLSPDARTS